MTTQASFANRLQIKVPPQRRSLAARIAGVVFGFIGVLLLAGGVFRTLVWTPYPAMIGNVPVTGADAGKGADVTFTVRLPDGRSIQTTERLAPSAVKHLQDGGALDVRCRAGSDARCETARAISDRFWLGLVFAVAGIGMYLVGARQARLLARLGKTDNVSK